MKKSFRYIVFLTLMLVMGFGTSLSSRITAAPVQNTIDPVCLLSCQQQQVSCFIGAATNSDQNRCLANYRHCIARCGKE